MIYKSIIDHYESCLDRHGTDQPHLAVDWPNAKDADSRYEKMLEIVPVTDPCTLLDFGCGLSGLKTHLDRTNRDYINYTGLDISKKFVDESQKLFPRVEYLHCDILKHRVERQWDWVICNGVLTEKRELSFGEMWSYARDLLLTLFGLCRQGMTFNVMSNYVDYQKDFLFHLPVTQAVEFVASHLSRKFVIHHMNYGLYEYTFYVYR